MNVLDQKNRSDGCDQDPLLEPVTTQKAESKLIWQILITLFLYLYRKGHGTESTLHTEVVSDLLLSADDDKVSFLALHC